MGSAAWTGTPDVALAMESWKMAGLDDVADASGMGGKCVCCP